MKNAQKIILTLCMASPSVLAASLDRDAIDLTLRAAAQETDNALRSHSNLIQERQDILGASFNANLKNEWVNFSSSYDLTHWSYEKNSQSDYNQIEGRSRLVVGQRETPVGLSLTQSRSATLVAPGAVDISTNRDERTISSAQPWVNWRIDGSDDLRLEGNYSEIDFRKNESKNLTGKGGALEWSHQLSKTDQFGLVAQATRNNYEFSPEFDYDYKAVLAQYAVKLSHISYSIAAGENTATQLNNNQEVKSPTYKINVDYRSSANDINFYFSKSVTDTSNGNGNRELVNNQAPQGVENAKDLIQLTEKELSWTTHALCALCNLGFGATLISNDYETLPDDETQKRYSLRFGYQFSRLLSVNFTANRDQHSFGSASLRTDYVERISEAALEYKLAKSTQLKFYVRKDQRDAKVETQVYVEKMYGLSLAVTF